MKKLYPDAKKGTKKFSKEFDAIWQYLIDHSIPGPKGICIHFCMEHSKADFKRRVQFRMNGIYRQTDDEVAEAIENTAKSWEFSQKYSAKKSRRIEALRNGKWWQRGLLYIYFKLGIFLRLK